MRDIRHVINIREKTCYFILFILSHLSVVFEFFSY